MKAKRSLAQKILLVAMVPLLFELGFMATLMILLHHAEQEHFAEAHAGMVVTQMNSCVASVLGAGMYFVLYQLTGDPGALNGMRKCAEFMSAQTDELKASVKNDSATLRSQVIPFADDAKAQMEKAMTMRAMLRQSDAGGSVSKMDLSTILQLGEMQASMREIIDGGTEIAGQQLVFRERRSESEKKLRHIINTLLQAGVVASIAISVGAATAFNLNVAKRVNRVAANTRKFAEGRDLEPPLCGDDEIADLDQTFASMIEKLKESRRREGAVINEAADVICTINRNGIVETMNSACKRFWGYDPKDIVGKSIADLASEEEQENLARLLRKAFAGDTEPFELVMRYADGRTRDTSWTARLLPSSGLLACVVHDISDSKQLERLKLQFGGLVRENLRGPLHSMKDIVDAVEARSKSISPQIEQSLHSTGVEINRLIGLVDRLALLHFADGAGAMPTNRESLSPKDLIAAAKSSVMAVAQKQNIEIAVAPCPSSVISGNRDDLVRVLVNLLGNAIKFSPEASTIVVACRDEDNSCVFQVVDQGPGIPLEFRRTIFEQFSQVTGSKSTVEQGTGLGLAVCKQVIIGHGGDIGVDCPANGGSTFWFRLPRSSSEIRS